MKIEKIYRLPFPPEQVFAAWISSDTVIPPAKQMQIEPVVGGRYQLFMEGASNEGRFAEIVKNRLLRYSWEWNRDGENTKITVRFEPKGDSTVVSILHDGFTSAESKAAHDSGWDSYLRGLEAHLKQNC